MLLMDTYSKLAVFTKAIRRTTDDWKHAEPRHGCTTFIGVCTGKGYPIPAFGVSVDRHGVQANSNFHSKYLFKVRSNVAFIKSKA
jgi:hypothetical protein